MTKKRSAKNAFISSLVMLCLCVTMLVGTTFAWYTDSVTSGRNTIVAGSLDMSIELYTGNTNGGSFTNNWEPVTNTTKIFAEDATTHQTSFEPGAAQVAYVRVKNSGDLAFKYSLAPAIDSETPGTNQAGQQFYLSNFLYFRVVEIDDGDGPFTSRSDAIGNDANPKKITEVNLAGQGQILNANETSKVIALVIYMPEETGNAANPDPATEKPTIKFGLNALATQYQKESDSFNNEYDKDLTLPTTTPSLATVTNGEATFTSSEAPVDNKTTTVAITSLDNVNDNDTLTLNVDTTDLTASAGNANFEVQSGNTAIAGIDLTLQNTAGQKVTFEGGAATITTYITPGLDQANITVKYNGEGADGSVVSYDPATGKLIFTVSHFSEYYVEYAGPFVYFPTTGKAYKVGDNNAYNELQSELYNIAEAAATDIDTIIDVDALIDAYYGTYNNRHKVLFAVLYCYCQGVNDDGGYNRDLLDFVNTGVTTEQLINVTNQYIGAYNAARETIINYSNAPVGFGSTVYESPEGDL